jgi:hypothetical protein
MQDEPINNPGAEPIINPSAEPESRELNEAELELAAGGFNANTATFSLNAGREQVNYANSTSVPPGTACC